MKTDGHNINRPYHYIIQVTPDSMLRNIELSNVDLVVYIPLHKSIQCYVKCSDYEALVCSLRCHCVLLFHPVLWSRVLRGKKSVFGEQGSDGWVMNLSQWEIVHMAWNSSKPYGLCLCLSLSLFGWSIIIRIYKNIIFTKFHINQSQLDKKED